MDLNEAIRLLSALVGVLGVVYWLWVAPERKRREAVQERLSAIERWQAVADRDLKAGDKKFDEMAEDLKDIQQCLHRLEKAFSAVAPALSREVK